MMSTLPEESPATEEKTVPPRSNRPDTAPVGKSRGESGGNGREQKKRKSADNASFWITMAIVLAMVFAANQFWTPKRFEIPMTELVRLIEMGPSPAKDGSNAVEVKSGEKRYRCERLEKIQISPFEVTGTVTRTPVEEDGKIAEPETSVPFFTGRSGLNFDNNALFDRFQDAGFTDVRAKGEPGWLESHGLTIVMTGLILCLFLFLFRKAGAGAFAFGRNRDVLVAPEDIDVSFADVAGVDEAVEELREIVDFLRKPEKFQLLGGRIPKGVLLVGPPGTGKTLLAKAVAGEAHVPFYSLSGSDFVELYAGVGAARVRDLFEQAQKASPAIIFIDELDALGRARSAASFGGAHDEREQTLNALLVEMDGFGTNSGTIVMAATNRPEILDSALLRSGRFDRQVLVDRPDLTGREEILKIHSRNVTLSPEVDLRRIATLTSGFVGADLGALVNEAALLAARVDKESVTMEEFTEAVERVTAGLQKKRRVMTEAEKKRVAFHESGHALAARCLPNADPVHKISIIPRGLAALGYTLQLPDDERYLMTQSELEDRIAVLLAGTIAEELVFADVSTGAQNDLERATEIARNMVMRFGMSRLGRVNYRESARSAWTADYGAAAVREHSEKTAFMIDEEVKSMIDALYRKTAELLSRRREQLDRLAARLLEKEVIDAEELDAVLNGPDLK